MCSISASRNKEELIRLVELNRYRGEESHSSTQFIYFVFSVASVA